MKNSSKVDTDDEEDATVFYGEEYKEMIKTSPVRSDSAATLCICSVLFCSDVFCSALICSIVLFYCNKPLF
jgi:hypothetical protein